MRASLIFIYLIFFLLAACSNEQLYAPVEDVNHIEPIPKIGIHRVSKGESLYEIAWRYGLDYRFLASANQIYPPYSIQPGQVILLRERKQKMVIKPVIKKPSPTLALLLPASNIPLERKPKKEKGSHNFIYDEPSYLVTHWIRPAKGTIINSFSGLNKGINIAGQVGTTIYAAAPGKVVYAGNGLRGYGNLIILKHNNLYLSAYAHNQRLLVREGEWVKGGQKIAEMGNTGTDKIMLHFEIRRAGKPIDPRQLF